MIRLSNRTPVGVRRIQEWRVFPSNEDLRIRCIEAGPQGCETTQGDRMRPGKHDPLLIGGRDLMQEIRSVVPTEPATGDLVLEKTRRASVRTGEHCGLRREIGETAGKNVQAAQ